MPHAPCPRLSCTFLTHLKLKERLIKLHHPLIHHHIPGTDGLRKYDAFQGTATTQGNVGLAMFKCAPAQIDDHFVKSLPLRFVNSNSPGGFERKLAEGADLLVHEAQYTSEELKDKKGWGHSSYEQAIEVAERAGVKILAT